jgi:hypothetical protein
VADGPVSMAAAMRRTASSSRARDVPHVQAHETGPVRPEVEAAAERDPALHQEVRRWVVAQAQCRAAQPGQIAGLWRDVAHPRQVGREQLGEAAAVAVEMGQEFPQPGLPVLESGDRRQHAQVARPCPRLGRQGRQPGA